VVRALRRSVPEDVKTGELDEMTEWLGELVRQVDSSLLDEWEALAAGVPPEQIRPGGGAPSELLPVPAVTTNERAFTVMVRNAVFRRVELLARGDAAALAASEGPGGWDEGAFRHALAALRAAHPQVLTGGDARSAALVQVGRAPGRWQVRQVLDDAEGDRDWGLHVEVDLAASDELGEPVLRTVALDDSTSP
jgi:hypothetical protein